MDLSSNAYAGYWYIEGQVYYLKLPFEPSLFQFRNAFSALLGVAASLEQPISLVLDVSELHITGSTWVNILEVNRELRNLPLAQAMVIGQPNHRLMKLMMLKLFDTVTEDVRFFETFDDVVGMAS